MTTSQKIEDATTRVVRAIKDAAESPKQAQLAMINYPGEIKVSWEDYFHDLFSETPQTETKS